MKRTFGITKEGLKRLAQEDNDHEIFIVGFFYDREGKNNLKSYLKNMGFSIDIESSSVVEAFLSDLPGEASMKAFDGMIEDVEKLCDHGWMELKSYSSSEVILSKDW